MPQASKHLNRLSCYFFNILKFKTLLKSANLAATGGLDGTVGGAENGIPQTELQGRFQYSWLCQTRDLTCRTIQQVRENHYNVINPQ